VGFTDQSKEAAFEAATVAAMFAVRDGVGVQINVPSAGKERKYVAIVST
jgi:hypothetical protein